MTPCLICSHPASVHGLDRKQRPTCFGASMCGCTEQPTRHIPDHLRVEDIQDYLRQKGEIS